MYIETYFQHDDDDNGEGDENIIHHRMNDLQTKVTHHN